ncbi:MAG TPA: efflux RND transporter periplasmic adaptor subunit [Candidatus Obscuribacter sp.]|nr:efflux RND transporter periplasmic adaptor subunit [Candidatus Obscuribacter sp.]HNG20648.1 efflux RND transporter periplasmic adaptor subunit [Candidatus Obscuribacter sp.]HNM49718.1 efflux RND transporter periplasmic adaptor subunit [Candidatus Obscuribacter sp.]
MIDKQYIPVGMICVVPGELPAGKSKSAFLTTRGAQMATETMTDPGTQTGRSHGKPPAALVLVVILLVLGALGFYLYPRLFPAPEPDNRISVSGRIEGYETNVGPKIGGRIDYVGFREGQSVKVGDQLIKLSDDEIKARLRGVKAKKQRAQEMVEESRYQITVVERQLEESNLRLTQSKEDTVAKVNEAEGNLAQAQARLAEAEAQLTQAKSELQLAKIRKQRYEFLASRGAVTTDENDQAKTTCDSQEALVRSRESAVQAAIKQCHVAQSSLEQARTTRLNPGMMKAQLGVLEGQLAQARFKLKSAEHEAASAQADEDEVLANMAYLDIKSPIEGIVTARAVEPGAVVVPGQTLMSLINLDTVYLRGYVPEGKIGKVRVGQTAKVVLDSAPDKPFGGKVIQIDPEGSFTPENIYFKDDRVKQVFGIKIGIDQPDRFAKPGMPAEAVIELDGSGEVGGGSGLPSNTLKNSGK